MPQHRRAARCWLPLAVAGDGRPLGSVPVSSAPLAKRLAREEDVVATYKLFGGVLLFPFWWALCAGLAGRLGGWPAALCAIPLAAASGWAAVLFHERRRRLQEEVRAHLLLRSRRALAADLARRRGAVVAELRALIDVHSTAIDRGSRSGAMRLLSGGGRTTF